MPQCIAHDPTGKARYLLQASKKSRVQIERLRASIYVDRDCRGARRGGFCDRGLFFTIHQISRPSAPQLVCGPGSAHFSGRHMS
jgi:hypothetical protein